MKAVLYDRYGGPEVLREAEVPLPQPGDGEVRIRVAAVGFNPADAGMRGGWLQEPFPLELPHVPGYDVAGVVDAVGAGTSGFAVGDPVVGFLSMTADGGSAQYVVTPPEPLVAAPATIPLVDAAALPSGATTAYQALFDAGGLQPGQRVLINGAGGGVGRYAVQLAHRAGAHVVATTGSATAARVAELGADEVLGHDEDPAAHGPYDVVLSLGSVPTESLERLTDAIRPGGALVNTVPSVPSPSGEQRGIRVDPFFVRSDAAVLARLVAMVDRGELAVDVEERLPLAELPEVHARSDRGELRGRTLLLPPEA